MNKALIKIIGSILIVATLSACAGQQNTGGNERSENTARTELTEKQQRQFSNLFMDASRAKILGNRDEALRLFNESLKIDPSSPVSKYEIARMLADENNFQAATGYAKDAYETDTQNSWYAQFLAQLYAETGQMEKSTAIFKRLVQDFPDEYQHYFSLGTMLSAQGKYDDALELYDGLEKRLGVNEELAMQRQIIYVEKGDYDKALTEVDKLIAENPDEIRLYGMKAEIYQQSGDAQKAKALYEQMLVMDPDNGLVLLSLHDALQREGDMERADDLLIRAFASADLGIDVKVNILLGYLSRNDFKKNEKIVKTLASTMEKAHPDDAKTYSIQGDIYISTGDLVTALSKFRKAVEIDPNRAPIWQQILTLDSQLNDFESLASESEAAIELFPQQSVFYLFNGVALLQQKKTDDAIESLSTGKNLVIDNPKLLGQFYASLGDAHHEAKNHIESDKAYRQALKFDPSNVVVLNNFAYYLSLRDTDLENAEAMSKKANNLSPDVASFQDTYGWVLYKRENYQNALFWIDEALKNGGANDPTVLEHKGDVLKKLNKNADALLYWQKALDAGGNREDIKPKMMELESK